MVIREQRFSFNQVRQVLGSVLDHDLHSKRVNSFCDATLGVLRSAALAVCAIGQGLAAAPGLNPKHATKQGDRLLSNPKIQVDDILPAGCQAFLEFGLGSHFGADSHIISSSWR